MKHDSEIGVALAAGHPCYFVGFLPDPMPGQTIEDVCEAEARFVEEVVKRHPNAEGKPCLIGNCQAGWQIMMMSRDSPGACRPDHARRIAAFLLGRRARQEPDALSRRAAGRDLADLAGRRSRQRHFRRRQSRREFRVAAPRQHLLEEDLQRLFEGRHRAAAVSRIREMVGQPGAAQCRGNAVDRRPVVRRQQARIGRTAQLKRYAHRPAQHQIADHRVLLVGRRHHAAAAGAATGFSISTITRTRSSTPARRSSIACIRALGTSASSSPAKWRRRSTRNLPMPWT